MQRVLHSLLHNSLVATKGLLTAEGGRGHAITYVYALCIHQNSNKPAGYAINTLALLSVVRGFTKTKSRVWLLWPVGRMHITNSMHRYGTSDTR